MARPLTMSARSVDGDSTLQLLEVSAGGYQRSLWATCETACGHPRISQLHVEVLPVHTPCTAGGSPTTVEALTGRDACIGRGGHVRASLYMLHRVISCQFP